MNIFSKGIFLFLLLCYNFSLAQDYTLSGIVVEKTSGETLIGASITVNETTNGTLTDADGKFSIRVNHGETLKVNFLGFQQEKVLIQGQNNIIVNLAEGLFIDEVVVTALGLERESKSLGYSVQELESRTLEKLSATNFLDNLTGKVAGVTVNQGATGVGSSSLVTIRGEQSFTNNNPLFVVDGIIINNSSILNVTNEAAAGFQEVDFGNGAMNINSHDLELVSVLKGPSAAALYGARASNGVIIMKTKSGTESDGLGIEFNSSVFVDSPFKLPEFQNSYGQGNSGQFEYVDGLGGGTNDNITYSYGPELDIGLNIPQYDSPVILADGTVVRGADTAVHGGAAISPTPFVSNPNNLKSFYDTGTTFINNIAISNRTVKSSFRLSLTDHNANSIIPGVNFKRKNALFNSTFNPTKRLKINATFNYINSQSDNRPASGYGSENINYALVAWLGRQTNLTPMKDYWQPGLEDLQQFSYNYTFFDNPYFTLLENQNGLNRDRIMGGLSTSFELTNQLSVFIRSGLDRTSELRTFKRAFSTNRFRNGAYAEHTVGFREINTDVLLNFNDTYNDFSIDASIGANRMNQFAEQNQNQTLSLAQPGVFSLNNAASPIEHFGFIAKKRINSIYGIAKFGVKNLLYLDFTARNDWSSSLATPNDASGTSFFYPAVSASLLLHEVMPVPDLFSFLKVRGSWAAVGNDADPYQTSGVFVPQTPYNGQTTFTDQNFVANENLVPERTQAFELGTDVRVLDDRISLDFSWYNSLTKNQILSLPTPISSGYNQKVINGGSVRTKGFEAILETIPVYKPSFEWRSTLNFSRNVATVESLPEEVDQITLGYNRVYDNVNQTVWFIVEEGSRIGDMWGTGYLKNEQGEFIITDDGQYIVDNNLIKLGNYNPDFILGWSNAIRWKDLSLSFTFDWRKGGEIVSRTQALAGVGGQLIETEHRPEEGIVANGVQNIGTAESPEFGTNTTAVDPESYYRQFYDRNHEENNTLNASYLKLKEFSLTYQLPARSKLISKTKGVSISLIGRNLFAISEIRHFDPEQIAVQGTQFLRGVEDMSYASSRSIGVSLSVKL